MRFAKYVTSGLGQDFDRVK